MHTAVLSLSPDTVDAALYQPLVQRQRIRIGHAGAHAKPRQQRVRQQGVTSFYDHLRVDGEKPGVHAVAWPIPKPWLH